MFIERLILSNFRCFGPEPCVIDLSPGLTTFVGVNGSGKTAVMQAFQRLFAVTSEQRRVRRQDFHIPIAEVGPVRQRSFVVEAIIAFPELDEAGEDDSVIPEFFHQMAADDRGRLKCRLRLQATWTDDGSLDGNIEQKFWAIRTFGDFGEADCIELKAVDRTRIQMIYAPAVRDAALDQLVHLAGAGDLGSVDEVALLVSARLDARRAGPKAAAAALKILDQGGERLQGVDHETVDGTLAHEIDGGAGQEDRHLQPGGDAAIGDGEGNRG